MRDERPLSEIQHIDTEIAGIIRNLGHAGKERSAKTVSRLDSLFHAHNQAWIKIDSGMPSHVRGMYYKNDKGGWKLF